jgi:hypothetical protein
MAVSDSGKIEHSYRIAAMEKALTAGIVAMRDILGLTPIRQSDEDADESIYVADTRLAVHFASIWLFPLCLFGVSVLLSSFPPRAFIRLPHSQSLTKFSGVRHHELTGFLLNLVPASHSLWLLVRFSNVTSPVHLSGALNVTLTTSAGLSQFHAAELPEAEIPLIAGRNGTAQYLFFSQSLLNFTNFSFGLTLHLPTEAGARVEFEWKTFLPMFWVITGVWRLALTVMVLMTAIDCCREVLDRRRALSWERKVVIALAVVVLLEIDPLFVMDLLFPSVWQRLAHSVLEDFGFGFLILLSVALTENTLENLPNHTFFVRPLLLGAFIVALCWMAVTEKLSNFDFGPRLLLLEAPAEFDWKTPVSMVFLCGWGARVVFLGVRGEEGHRQRLLSYSMAILFVWAGEIGLRISRPLFEESITVRVIPLALRVAFLFLIDQLHTKVSSLSYRALDANPLVHDADR